MWIYKRSSNSGNLFALSNLTTGKLYLNVYELGLRDDSLYNNLHASGYKIVGGNMFPISNDTTYKIDPESPETVNGYEFNQELNDDNEYFIELETAPLFRAVICNVTVSSGSGYIGIGGGFPSYEMESSTGYYYGNSGDLNDIIICDWGYIRGTSSTEFGLNNIRLVEDKVNYVEDLSKLAKISTILSGNYDYYVDDVLSYDGGLLSIKPYVKSDGVLRISCSQNGSSIGQSNTISGMFYLRPKNNLPTIKCNIWWK